MANNRDFFGIDFQMDFSDLIQGTVVLDDRLDRYVAGIHKQRSHIAVGWMKDNATWTDRTGAARSGLRTGTEHKAKTYHIIHLWHSVPYGIWLEVRHSGKYAIIIPAILDQGPKMMRTFNKLFARLGGGQ